MCGGLQMQPAAFNLRINFNKTNFPSAPDTAKRFARSFPADEVAQSYAEKIGKRNEIAHSRFAQAVFPKADYALAYIYFFSKLHLSYSVFLPQLFKPLAEYIHSE